MPLGKKEIKKSAASYTLKNTSESINRVFFFSFLFSNVILLTFKAKSITAYTHKITFSTKGLQKLLNNIKPGPLFSISLTFAINNWEPQAKNKKKGKNFSLIEKVCLSFLENVTLQYLQEERIKTLLSFPSISFRLQTPFFPPKLIYLRVKK